jgi:hypothetical protein
MPFPFCVKGLNVTNGTSTMLTALVKLWISNGTKQTFTVKHGLIFTINVETAGRIISKR